MYYGKTKQTSFQIQSLREFRNDSLIQALRKKCPYLELFWSLFPRIRTDYGEIWWISPYLVQMRENTDRNNSEYGHFSRSKEKRKSSKRSSVINHIFHTGHDDNNERSSRPEVFFRKGVLKICSKFTGEHACRSVISIKLFITLQHRSSVFSCKFAAYFQNTFS